MSFIQELKRRNVLRVGVAYLAASWVLLQIADVLANNLETPDWLFPVTVSVLVIGFPVALIISWVFELTPSGIKRESEIDRSQSITPQTGKRLDRAIIVVLVLAVAMLAFDRMILAPAREDELVKSAAEAATEQERLRTAPISAKSLVVLPFVNMSGNADNEYFSDGLTETLLHMLTQLPDLDVIARTTAFAFKGKALDVRDIAADLRVAYVLEGSVQRTPDRLRITAQLIRAADGLHEWSQIYDRELGEIFSIQDEIANDVALLVGSSLAVGESDAMRGMQSKNVDAYDLYLQAIHQQESSVPDALENADQLFRRALEVDPEFIDAKIGLARNNILMERDLVRVETSTIPESLTLLDSVLASQPENAVAQGLRWLTKTREAYFAGDRDDTDAGIAGLLQTVEHGHADSFVVSRAVEFLLSLGRSDEALAMADKGLVNDPLNMSLLSAKAKALEDLGLLDEAFLALQTAIKAKPEFQNSYWYAAHNRIQVGEVASALNFWRKAVEIDPDDKGRMYRRLMAEFYYYGFPEEAEFWLNQQRQLFPEHHITRRMEMEAAYALGDRASVIAHSRALIELYARPEATNHKPSWLPVMRYAYSMHEAGRSAEALDFLKSIDDQILNSTDLPQSRLGVNMQMAALMLLFDVLDEDAYQDWYASLVDALEADGVVTDDDPDDKILNGVFRDRDPNSVSDVFIEATQSPVLFIAAYRTELLENPWFEELRSLPEVEAALETHYEQYADTQAEIGEMLKAEEWQH